MLVAEGRRVFVLGSKLHGSCTVTKWACCTLHVHPYISTVDSSHIPVGEFSAYVESVSGEKLVAEDKVRGHACAQWRGLWSIVHDHFRPPP